MSITYKSAGVNKEAGYSEVELIKKFIKNTYTNGVISELGGFSGLFELDKSKYEKPILVSGTDGVGTKVKIAQLMDKHDTVGIDCVAMCVNDILCQGAKTLFFLDYIATGKLLPEKMATIVKGVADGCICAGAALIGGETAEMPGIYKDEDYDIAGFCVGIVDKDKIINGKENIKEGNTILALPSSGIHSNGFSLVRKIVFEHKNFDLKKPIFDNKSILGEELLKPTKIYAKEIEAILDEFKINGISHITGGGIFENVPRILPANLDANIYENNIPKLPIFDLIKEWGEISKLEMFSTFNMGMGMLLVVDNKDADNIIKKVQNIGKEIFKVGEIVSGTGKVQLL